MRIRGFDQVPAGLAVAAGHPTGRHIGPMGLPMIDRHHVLPLPKRPQLQVSRRLDKDPQEERRPGDPELGDDAIQTWLQVILMEQGSRLLRLRAVDLLPQAGLLELLPVVRVPVDPVHGELDTAELPVLALVVVVARERVVLPQGEHQPLDGPLDLEHVAILGDLVLLWGFPTYAQYNPVIGEKPHDVDVGEDLSEILPQHPESTVVLEDRLQLPLVAGVPVPLRCAVGVRPLPLCLVAPGVADADEAGPVLCLGEGDN
mmetsp:Transcript_70016/g.123420  ORF Transcript_70016/g.123420 Transcript_70016/m.123420 type:complete len:259 (+) Transcript_70016:1391-2167(+)